MLLYLLFYLFSTYYFVYFYFVQKIQNGNLFKKTKYDFQVFLLFGWMLFLPPFLLTPIRMIIVYDQVSRHIERFINFNFSKKYTNYAYTFFNFSKLNDYNLIDLTFIGLCVRHYVRDFSDEIEIGSKRLETIINLINERSLDIKKINNENLKVLRCNNAQLKDTIIRNEYRPDNELISYIGKILKEYTNPNDKLVLLLSGGIDSMTLAHIFYYSDFPINFEVLHFDWKKRLESTDEANYLYNYFTNINPDIPFHLITYTGNKNSLNWDAETTTFRYQVLRNLSDNIEEKGQHSVFVTGHVANDVIENFCMNLGNNSKATDVLSLVGMVIYSEVKGFTIFRPLLYHKKPNGNNVPHIKDNAELLDHRRRVFRRMLGEYDMEYGIEYGRIIQIQKQFTELERYIYYINRNGITFSLFMETPSFILKRFYPNYSLKSIEFIKHRFNVGLRSPFPLVLKINEKIYRFENLNSIVIL